MFLVLEVEVVEHLTLLGLGDVGVRGFSVESLLPEVDLAIFLLDKPNEILVLFEEVLILGE